MVGLLVWRERVMERGDDRLARHTDVDDGTARRGRWISFGVERTATD